MSIFQAAKKTLIVGAIDFGTTFSGWAYSFLHEYKSDPTKATVQHWYGGQLVTEKTPTCALITSKHKLEAFGYEAENKFKDLVENNEHHDFYYFRRFKMDLNKGIDKKFSLDFKIKDEMGKSLSALTVFALSIEFLTNDMMRSGENKVAGGITKDDIHWVLTVPAIWTDSAKQFMRKAAVEGGIHSENLTIALEPEAASIFCRHLPVDKFEDLSGDNIAKYPPGTKYMILDAGGGTIDITIHEITSSGNLKEIKAASGGGWGGILVDKAFEDLLIDILGKDVYGEFLKKETEDWIDLGRTFELKKKTIDPRKDNRINMKLPLSLIRLFQKKKGKALEDTIAETKYASDIELRGDKVRFESGLMKSLFKNSIQKTVNHVKTLLKEREVRDIKAILMVGGFSESPMLQEAIKQSFRNVKVIIPKEAASAVLRGAVCFGHNPTIITERVLKFTYGVKCKMPFRDGIDPKSKLVWTDMGPRCDFSFDKHVARGQSVTVGEAQSERDYTPSFHDQTILHIWFYASELTDPDYVDDPGCECIGKLDLDISHVPGGLEDKRVYLSFTFSDTEIQATARIEETDEEVTARFDFLG